MLAATVIGLISNDLILKHVFQYSSSASVFKNFLFYFFSYWTCPGGAQNMFSHKAVLHLCFYTFLLYFFLYWTCSGGALILAATGTDFLSQII